MKGALVLALWAALACGPAAADIDESAYQAGDAVKDQAARGRLLRQLEQEAEAERRREREQAEAERRIEAERQAREAARPLSERLAEHHCTACHTAENYATKGHTWLGWRLVVARMVWLNDAAIPFDDRGLIADHLAQAHPASPDDALWEFAYTLSGGLALLGLPWAALLLLGQGRRKYRR
jgi:hypothetical protein